MTQEIDKLKERIMIEPGVLDSPGVHHELAGGGHGQKLSFSGISSNSDLYNSIIEHQAQAIRDLYDPIPNALAGMATSANRFAKDTAEMLGNEVLSLETEKNSQGQVIPTYLSRLALRRECPDFLLVVEDVGTTGKTVAKFLEKLEVNFSIPKVEVLFIWQRRPSLTILNKRRIAYNALINHPLKTYQNKKDCMNDSQGFCAQGWDLVPRRGKLD